MTLICGLIFFFIIALIDLVILIINTNMLNENKGDEND